MHGASVGPRLLDVIEKHELLHKFQYEFLRNGCTATPIEIMTAAISDSRARGKSCHLAFLDATSAYDVVPDYALELGLAHRRPPLLHHVGEEGDERSPTHGQD